MFIVPFVRGAFCHLFNKRILNWINFLTRCLSLVSLVLFRHHHVSSSFSSSHSQHPLLLHSFTPGYINIGPCLPQIFPTIVCRCPLDLYSVLVFYSFTKYELQGTWINKHRYANSAKTFLGETATIERQIVKLVNLNYQVHTKTLSW